jgi:hypothetical protein
MVYVAGSIGSSRNATLRLADPGSTNSETYTVKIPRWRIALTGSALIVMTVAGIGLAQAAPPTTGIATQPAAAGAPAASGSPSAAARLRPFRNLVHGTITFDHPEDGLITVQLDGGTISAVDGDSITIAEAAGASVTVAIDDETRVRIARKRSTVAELKAGQTVRVVSRIADGATTAKRIVVLPAAD